MATVALLLSCHGHVVSVYERTEDAQARRDRFNADPWIEPGTPDVDAPYTVQAWSVTDVETAWRIEQAAKVRAEALQQRRDRAFAEATGVRIVEDE